MNKSHKHAGLMKLYYLDAEETETPWERWEELPISGNRVWRAMNDNPTWHPNWEYRRKPKTISINGFEVPEPLREAPKIGQSYFIAEISNESVVSITWGNDEIDNRWFSRGLIHLTKEAAELHAKALLSFTQKVNGGPR